MLLMDLSLMILWFEVSLTVWLDWMWMPKASLILTPDGERVVALSWLCFNLNWTFDPNLPTFDGEEEE